MDAVNFNLQVIFEHLQMQDILIRELIAKVNKLEEVSIKSNSI